MSEPGITVTGWARDGRAREITVDLYTCEDIATLCRLFEQQATAIRKVYADPEWPLRVERDATFRDELLTYLANAGLLLARLTELTEAPPERAHEDALDIETLRLATEDMIARGRTPRPNVIELLRERGARVRGLPA